MRLFDCAQSAVAALWCQLLFLSSHFLFCCFSFRFTVGSTLARDRPPPLHLPFRRHRRVFVLVYCSKLMHQRSDGRLCERSRNCSFERDRVRRLIYLWACGRTSESASNGFEARLLVGRLQPAIKTTSNHFRIIIFVCTVFGFSLSRRTCEAIAAARVATRERALLLRERCQTNHVLSKFSISFTVEDDNVINGCRGATALDVQPMYRSKIAHAEHVADARSRCKRRNYGKRRKAIIASSHTYKLSDGGAAAGVIECVDRARGRGKSYRIDAERCRAIIIAHLAFERQFGVLSRTRSARTAVIRAACMCAAVAAAEYHELSSDLSAATSVQRSNAYSKSKILKPMIIYSSIGIWNPLGALHALSFVVPRCISLPSSIAVRGSPILPFDRPAHRSSLSSICLSCGFA